MPQSDELRLTTEEQSVMREMFDSGNAIEEVLPDSIDAGTFWRYLPVACKSLGWAELVALKIHPFVGRLLLIAENNPSLWLDRGFKTFPLFMDYCQTLGLGKRTKLYERLFLAKKFPTISPDDFAEIGPDNLKVLAKVTDESMPSHREHLERAKTHTKKQLVAHYEEQGAIAKGEATPAIITFMTSREIAHLFNEFTADGRIQSKCGSADKGIILMRMIQECSMEWLKEEEVA